jgi:hypothetical protein
MTERFVGVRPERLRALMDAHGLEPMERLILTGLVLEVDHRTGTWKGTQEDLGPLLGLSARNLRPRLRQLEDRGLIECRWVRGYPGSVTVLDYLEVVHLSPSQRTEHPLQGRARNGRSLPLRAEDRNGRNVRSERTEHPLRNGVRPGHSVAPSGLSGSADVIPLDSRARGSGQGPPASATARGACPDPTRAADGGRSDSPPVRPPVAQGTGSIQPSSREWLRDPRALSPEVIHRGQA